MRTTLRASLEARVRFTAIGGVSFEPISGEGVVQNLSTGGLCFVTDKRLTPGEVVELTFSANGETFLFRGEIVRSGESGGGYMAGVRFDAGHPETEESLQKLASLGAD
ncbi:MAG TPA: PilZ domain-containing protein [Geobacteraceae bacterium]